MGLVWKPHSKVHSKDEDAQQAGKLFESHFKDVDMTFWKIFV